MYRCELLLRLEVAMRILYPTFFVARSVLGVPVPRDLECFAEISTVLFPCHDSHDPITRYVSGDWSLAGIVWSQHFHCVCLVQRFIVYLLIVLGSAAGVESRKI